MKKIVVCAMVILVILSITMSGILAQDKKAQDKKDVKKVEKTCCSTEKKAEQKGETACGGCATDKPTCTACPASNQEKAEKKTTKKVNKK